jgi:transcriptional regulator with XRE-family HTH domain
MSNSATGTTIEVNGYAIREIRLRMGLATRSCAEAIGIDRSYLAGIELGKRTRVSPPVFASICRVLALDDTRAIRANPHGTAAEAPATGVEAIPA